MKRALITGGTGGLGEAIVKQLASDYHVIIHVNKNWDKAESLLSAVVENGGSAEICQFDATDTLLAKKSLEELLSNGPIQVLINNLGVHDDAPMAGMSDLQWKKVIDVNLNSFYTITQPLLLPMMSTRWGRIVTVSSVAGLVGNKGQVNYSASKAGLHGASRSLAVEVASRGITVNVVAPGIIETKMSEAVFDEARIKAMVPLQRAGQPEEVAALIEYLLSDKAGYITGQVISINGGMI